MGSRIRTASYKAMTVSRGIANFFAVTDGIRVFCKSSSTSVESVRPRAVLRSRRCSRSAASVCLLAHCQVLSPSGCQDLSCCCNIRHVKSQDLSDTFWVTPTSAPISSRVSPDRARAVTVSASTLERPASSESACPWPRSAPASRRSGMSAGTSDEVVRRRRCGAPPIRSQRRSEALGRLRKTEKRVVRPSLRRGSAATTTGRSTETCASHPQSPSNIG